ncbi:helix-turn-helix domain-containing protein, partial [Herbiconiux daphne]
EIDEYGNVKSYSSKTHRKTCLDCLGQVGLTINKKRVLVKNLVAQTFIRDFDLKREYVIYLDGNTNNHHYKNLDIVPIDRFKLTPEAAEEIRKQYKSGDKLRTIASKYNVSLSMISQIVNGKRY